MRKISSVHIDIARFSYEIGIRNNDSDLAAWVRNFVRCLVMRDPKIDSYGAELLSEVAEFRKTDAERKAKRFPVESAGIHVFPENSVNKEQSIKEHNKKEPKGSKEAHGEFCNVMLTPEEKLKLVEKYGEKHCKDMIERLSQYIASKGVKYKSHYATMLGWFRKEPERYQKQNEEDGDRWAAEMNAKMGLGNAGK